MATIDQTRTAAVDLLDSLNRAISIRAEVLAAAARLCDVGEACVAPRLEGAVNHEAEGIASDVERGEASLDHLRSEVQDFLELLTLATAEPVEAAA